MEMRQFDKLHTIHLLLIQINTWVARRIGQVNTANAIVEHGQLTAFNGLNALCNPRTKVAYEVTDVLNIVYRLENHECFIIFICPTSLG